MPVNSTPSPTPTCRRYFLPVVIACWLVLTPLAPGRAASSYRPLAGPYPVNPSSLPQYYYPSPDAVLGGRGFGMGGEWRSNDRPVSHKQQGSQRTPFGPVNAEGDTGVSNPVIVGEWTSRRTVSKTKDHAFLATPSYDFGLREFQDDGRGFRAMPPFQPPPSSSHLPDPFYPSTFNYSSPFGSIGQRPTRAAAATGTKGINKKMKRDPKTAGISLGGYDKDIAEKDKQRRQYRWAGPGILPPFLPPPSNSLLPDLVHPHNFNFSDFFGKHQAKTPGFRFDDPPVVAAPKQAIRNSVGQSDDQAYAAAAHGAAKLNYWKRVAETADLSLGGYNNGGHQRGGRDKRYRSQGQLFNPMPPFQPPPSSSILPDLFSEFNHSFIGQRPTRPSATRSRLPINHGLQSDNRGPLDQLPGPGEVRSGPSGTGGVWGERNPGTRRHSGPPVRPFDSLPSDTPRDLPTQGSEDRTDAQQEQTHPRDVVVKIDTPRLQLTYRVIAPPYFTFEGLLSQMATYLIPGFCVDLAVTRWDEHCDIISHMAALQTDRQQTWLIEIVDTGGKIIWMNQCLPDVRLFVVPGLRINFKFGTHNLVPGSILPVSTPADAAPGVTVEAFKTAQPPPGLPTSDSGWVPHGPPLVPNRQT